MEEIKDMEHKVNWSEDKDFTNLQINTLIEEFSIWALKLWEKIDKDLVTILVDKRASHNFIFWTTINKF